jgi:hypothetical protein
MPRFSISSIPVLALAGLASVSAALPVACSAQTQVSPQTRREAIALMKVCRGDYDRLCASVRPGGGRVLACLQNHANQLSAACGQALPRAQSLRASAAAGATPK